VGEIFKESTNYREASKKAVTISNYFTSKNHTYFIGKLREIQKSMYNKYQNLVVPGFTQWNSYYYCFSSLLKTRDALKVWVYYTYFCYYFFFYYKLINVVTNHRI